MCLKFYYYMLEITNNGITFCLFNVYGVDLLCYICLFVVQVCFYFYFV